MNKKRQIQFNQVRKQYGRRFDGFSRVLWEKRDFRVSTSWVTFEWPSLLNGWTNFVVPKEERMHFLKIFKSSKNKWVMNLWTADTDILSSFREAIFFLTRFRQAECSLIWWNHGKIKSIFNKSIFKLINYENKANTLQSRAVVKTIRPKD